GRRRRERADHPLLRRVVEHPAPGPDVDEARQPFDHDGHAGPAARDDRRVHVLLRLARFEPAAGPDCRTGTCRSLAAAARGGGSQMSDFLAMGGHAPYVWSAYGITLLVILLNIWAARRVRVRALERLARTSEEPRARRQPTVRQVE